MFNLKFQIDEYTGVAQLKRITSILCSLIAMSDCDEAEAAEEDDEDEDEDEDEDTSADRGVLRGALAEIERLRADNRNLAKTVEEMKVIHSKLGVS